jgi:hypothetical protein
MRSRISKVGVLILLLLSTSLFLTFICSCQQNVVDTSASTSIAKRQSLKPSSSFPQAQASASSVTNKRLSELRSGMVAIYFQATYDSWQQYLGEYGKASGATYGVFRYLPETTEVSLIEDIASASFAEQKLYPRTEDGRLFLVDNDRTEAEIREIDPVNNEHLEAHAYLRHESNYLTWDNFAIIGDQAYFRAGSTVWSEPHLYTRQMVENARSRIMLNARDKDNVGSLLSAGGNLYRWWRESEDTQIYDVYQVSLATGKNVERICRLSPANPDDYLDNMLWLFAADEEALWIAANRRGDPVTGNLYRLPWDTPENAPQLVLSQPGGIVSLDADGGYVLFGRRLYDSASGEIMTLEIPSGASFTQVLKVR